MKNTNINNQEINKSNNQEINKSNKNYSKEYVLFSEFVFKIYNYFVIAYIDFSNKILKEYNKINDRFLFCILYRGIFIIEKIFIFNIFIDNYDIQKLQNIFKKLIDLYFKFIDQMIAMNNNINLNIKDAEIFIYKKFIDKSINDFKYISKKETNFIKILKLNNNFLITSINNYKVSNRIININSNDILNYYKEFNQQIKKIK